MKDSTAIYTDLRSRRLNALQRQVQRLQARLDRLQVINSRFSWYRLAGFVLAVAVTWLAVAYLPEKLTWVVLLFTVGAFSVLIFLHRRLDGWIARYTVMQHIKADKVARMTLDWDVLEAGSRPADADKPSSLAVDLDLTGERSLHRLLDLAVSVEGSQLLADWLTDSRPDPGRIQANQPVVRELADLPFFIDRLLLNLRMVSAQQLSGKRLLSWLAVKVSPSRLRAALLFGWLLAVINATLFVLNVAGLLPAYWPFTLVLSLGFYFLNASLVGEFLEAVIELDSELDQFTALLRYLEAYPYRDRKHLAQLCQPFTDRERLPSRQVRRVKTVTAAIGMRSNPVLGILLNALLPWDFTFAWLAGRMQSGMQDLLPAWLQTWYRLESLCSLANFAYLNPGYNFPEVQLDEPGGDPEQPVFQAHALGHPLIPHERKICNDFTIPGLGEVIVITGSNMAGKSTFIKTVGVNLCLAYAGGPVNAARFSTIPFRLHTCIRISDSITDGFSYFYAEVKCLRALLEALHEAGSLPLLYLIDEIFRGTNNRERLIGSQAYVSSLIDAHGAGLIATHDLELAGLERESPRVHNFHFRDRVEQRRLAFDYQLLPGPCPTTNALKIMQMEGLPVGESQS